MSKSNYDPAKKTKGRQRIEMKKMRNERNLQVTFSKRRAGVFKKASELCTLCGADIAVIIFSPAHRVFSFGSPSVETVINRFLNWAPPPPPPTVQNILDAHYTANVHDLNAHLTLINNEIESEKNRGEELGRLMRAAQTQLWWACPIGDMNQGQLEQLKTKLEALKELVNRHIEKLLSLSAITTGSSSSDANNAIVHQPLSLQDPMLQNRVFDHVTMKWEPDFDNVGGYEPDDRFC